MTDSSQIYTKIAAEWAKIIWENTGMVLGHVALGLGAHGAVEYANPTPGGAQPTGFRAKLASLFSLVNPLPKAKKLGLLGVFEAIGYYAHKPFTDTWNALTPIVEKVMTPTIELLIRAPLNYLKEKGYATFVEPAKTFSNSAHQKIANTLMKEGAGITTAASMESGIETLKQLANDAAKRAADIQSKLPPIPQPIIKTPVTTYWFSPGDWSYRLSTAIESLYQWPFEVIEEWKNSGQAAIDAAKAQQALREAAKLAQNNAADLARQLQDAISKQAALKAEEQAKTAAEQAAMAAEEAAKTQIRKSAEELYRFADKAAPKVGRFFADGLESTCEYGSKFIQTPGKIVQAFADATGLPYPVALGISIGMVGLAYYGLSHGFSRITQTVTVDAKGGDAKGGDAHAQANNNFGGVHFHLSQAPDAQHSSASATPLLFMAPGAQQGVPQQGGIPRNPQQHSALAIADTSAGRSAVSPSN
jgi:hypothetical protein